MSTNDNIPTARFTQVVSDVDDTLKSSGGVNVGGVALGGIDVQYERGDFYPGVGEFMLELSRYGLPQEALGYPAKIAILTARAEEFKAALEIKDESKLAVALRTAGEKAGIEGWGVGPVLYGSVAEWIAQDRKGLRKFTNFERLIEQDPTGTIFQVRWRLSTARSSLTRKNIHMHSRLFVSINDLFLFWFTVHLCGRYWGIGSRSW